MALRIPLLLAVGGALAVIPTAAAGKSLPIAVGDTIDVTGTKVACFVVNAENRKGIGCFLATSKGFTPGTYGVALSESGDAIVSKVEADGSATPLWQNRKKASARARAGRYYGATAGDGFALGIKGGALGCKVFDIATGGPKYAGRRVVCFRSVKTKPIPRSYGVVVSNKFAGSLRFDATGNVGPTTFVRFQPS